ncbi:MAG: ABC transporter ATP-binding protein [Candidatus Omnitrophica bacterium]|nr:ABC transporter ATP-binding protein [Candidatus Omnitrophota bacterium]
MRQYAIETSGLTKRFGRFTAVDNLNLRIATGEIFGFLGPNGAGKSTTIKMLCGILAPTGGTGQVAGFDISREPEQVKQSIGYMSQRFSFYKDLTVKENVDFYAGIYGVRDTVRIEEVLAGCSLIEKRDVLSGELPPGLRQRLALACAILHKPKVLFLDEPTAGVDPLSKKGFWRLIDELAQSRVTIFVTTHRMDEAEYCHELGFIYQGRLVAFGSPAELKKDGVSLEELFITLTR